MIKNYNTLSKETVISMGSSLKAFGLMVLLTASAFAENGFPTSPELTITPGKLCNRPSARRYAEKIAYCERDVSYETKEIIIEKYDDSFGYRVGQMKRDEFKIDHLIPLCVGGSNDMTNLWPQHKTVYTITDPLEPELCSKMLQGRLKQAEAVLLVIEAKTHLDRVSQIIKYVKSL